MICKMVQDKVTIKDIAREAGVSTTLVSFVMNNKSGGGRNYRVGEQTRRKVLEVADRLNYQPNINALALRRGETRIIGVLLPDIANKFYSQIARMVSEWASNHKYTVVFGNTDENPDKLAELLYVFMSSSMDGFIIVPCENSQGIISSLHEDGIPFVLLDRDIPELNANAVVLDSEDATHQLTLSLAGDGCRRVGMISREYSLPLISERENGYLRGVAEAGLEFCCIERPAYCDYGEIREAVGRMAERSVDGIVFVTFHTAVLGLKAMKELGIRVPEDCRVACFSNGENLGILETYEREICYVPQPIAEFARESLDLLLKIINGDGMSGTKVLLHSNVSKIN